MGKPDFRGISSLFEGLFSESGAFYRLELDENLKLLIVVSWHPARRLTGDISNQFSLRQLSYLIMISPELSRKAFISSRGGTSQKTWRMPKRNLICPVLLSFRKTCITQNLLCHTTEMAKLITNAFRSKKKRPDKFRKQIHVCKNRFAASKNRQ